MKHLSIGAIIMTVIQMLGLLWAPAIGATAWNDRSQAITLSYQTEVLGLPDPYCHYSYQSFLIEGETQHKKVCANNTGKGLVVGYYTDQSRTIYVMGSRLDDKLYQLRGCDRIDNCLYVASIDALFMKRRVADKINAYSMKMYKDLSSHLRKTYDNALGRTVYEITTPEADFKFQGGSGNDWLIGAWSVSENERWMILEMRDRGFGVLDLQSMRLKRISSTTLYYGYGMNPTAELSISNDGSLVAIAGSNAGASLIMNDDTCGDYPTDAQMDAGVLLAISCPQRQLPVNSVTPDYYATHAPAFNENAGQLTVYVVTRAGKVYLESFRPPYSQVAGVLYLAMGDSFTSGEGETSNEYYLNGTDTPYEKCHVSKRSYPFLVGELFDLSADAVKNMACSGARMSDISGSEIDYWGQGGRLGDGGLGLSALQRSVQQQRALTAFVPGEIHQEKFVDLYHPDLVTLGISGNDAGLMGKLQTCLMPGTCEWASTQEKIYQTGVEIDNLSPRLASMYQKIQRLSPSSSFYAVGYPQIISDKNSCGLLDNLLDGDERTFIRRSITRINSVIERAARSVGISYIDVEDVFSGYELCEDARAVNNIRLGDDVAFFISSLPKFIGNESFHPTPFGHELLANRIVDVIRHGQSETDTTDDTLYWAYDAQDITRQMNVEMVRKTVIDDQTDFLLDIPSGSLEPDSAVDISLHSSPRFLASATVTASGGLQMALSLPGDTEPGFHTIHVEGVSYSGTKTDLYQVIRVATDTGQLGSEPDSQTGDTVDTGTGNINTFRPDETGQMSEQVDSAEHLVTARRPERPDDGQRDTLAYTPVTDSKVSDESVLSANDTSSTDNINDIQNSTAGANQADWRLWISVAAIAVVIIMSVLAIYKRLSR